MGFELLKNFKIEENNMNKELLVYIPDLAIISVNNKTNIQNEPMLSCNEENNVITKIQNEQSILSSNEEGGENFDADQNRNGSEPLRRPERLKTYNQR